MSAGKELSPETDLAVRRSIARFFQLEDDGDLDALVELFTEDGWVHVATPVGDGDKYTGRAAIKAWLEGSPLPALHDVANVVVSYGSQPDTVHAVSDVVIWNRSEGGGYTVAAIGRYHDTLVGVGRDLQFSQRIMKFK
jgi:ketosteroid isomerase-like protein